MRPLALVLLTATATAQTPLHQQLTTLAAEAQGKVYVACSLPGTPLDCDLNPHGHPPMQSTFKFPLAMAVLHQVELGKLQLDQPIRFLKSDRYPTYSPLQDKYPNAEIDIPLRTLLQLTASESDNIASNLLLRAIGGPTVLQQYIDSLGLSAIHQQDSEQTLHADQTLQYRNSAEPAAMVTLLRLFADPSPLTPANTALLNPWILETPTGPHRIRGLLPPGTPVAHKTGSSGEEWSRIPATNDVGLITLPNGQRLALAIFVTDAHANQDACDHTIATIAQAIYNQALAKQK